MSAAVKFLYYVSIVFFLLVLLYTYYQFPSVVAIGYSENIEMQEFKEKEWLFYAAGGFFLVFNLLVIILKKAIGSFPASVLPSLQKSYWTQSPDHKEILHRIYETWFNSFAFLFNCLLMFILVALFLINVVGFKSFQDYQPIILGWSAIVALWWIVLPVRQLVKTEVV
jgi:hypothetical protein